MTRKYKGFVCLFFCCSSWMKHTEVVDSCSPNISSLKSLRFYLLSHPGFVITGCAPFGSDDGALHFLFRDRLANVPQWRAGGSCGSRYDI